MAPGSFNVLGDQLNERLKKVFETKAEAAEPNIYKGTFVHSSKFQIQNEKQLIEVVISFD